MQQEGYGMEDSDHLCCKPHAHHRILPEANPDVPGWLRWCAAFVIMPGMMLSGLGIKFLVDPESHHPVAGAILTGIQVVALIALAIGGFFVERRRRR